MKLSKLFETQKVLRDRINYNEPDRFNKLILALLVELGECANEWRGFKFWSKNQNLTKPLHTTQGATPENAVYFKCMNDDGCGEYLYHDDFKNLFDEPNYEDCPKCEEGYVYPFREANPLLEEYVDVLHFVLELGLEIGYDSRDSWGLDQIRTDQVEENITDQFRLVFYHTSMLADDDYYIELFAAYLNLGEMLGFTWKQIEQAYFEKNEVNHLRQDSGVY